MTTTAFQSNLAADPEEMNDRRSHWASLALTVFQRATQTDDQDALCDLLTGLMHWADRHNSDFEAAMHRAEDHYREETDPSNGSGDQSPSVQDGVTPQGVASDLFSYQPGTDGTEKTFEIVHLPSDLVIAAFAYWEAEEEAEQNAALLVLALNSLHRNGYVHRRNFRMIARSVFESTF